MRQIKFRGKTTANGHWVYGSLIKYADDHCVIVGNGSPYVAPVTVGQFTGLTDCNGREIYEGDILKVDELAMPCEVIWYDKTASFQLRYHVEGGVSIPKDALGLWVQDYKSVITVISNVHDNPEMIK